MLGAHRRRWYEHQMPEDLLAFVLAGGRGTRLQPLTTQCSKPALSFGGPYRIIDFTLSNCLNSGIRRIGVLTQYRQQSLLKHLHNNWSHLYQSPGEFIDVIPSEAPRGYRGTADSIYANIDMIERLQPGYVMVLSGDHIYKADYRMMLKEHLKRQADVTVACIDVPKHQASGFGIMAVDDRHRITEFHEKPAEPVVNPLDANYALASMGVYIFNTDVLLQSLYEDAHHLASQHDFGHDIIPALIEKKRVIAYRFAQDNHKPYWRDVGTIDSYYNASLDLLDAHSGISVYDNTWPIRGESLQTPPAQINDVDSRSASLSNCLLSNGCVVNGAVLQQCVLSESACVAAHATLQRVVCMPRVHIGQRCKIRNTIIDADTHIPDGLRIGYDLHADAQRFQVSDQGVVVVNHAMIRQLSLSIQRRRGTSRTPDTTLPVELLQPQAPSVFERTGTGS